MSDVAMRAQAVSPPSPATLRTRGAWRGRSKVVGLTLLIFIVLVTAVEVIVVAFDISPVIFPRPSEIAAALWELIVRGTIFPHLWVTGQEILLGFVLGASIGFLLGAAVSESKWTRTLAYPYIVALQAIPKVAVAPLFLIWFGYGMESKVILALTVTFFPVLVNTIQGLSSADPDRIRLLRAYGASHAQVFLRVKLPSSLSAIFAGLEMSVVLAVIAAITAEFVGADEGLGYLIIMANTQLDTATNLAVVIVLSALGFVLSEIVRFAGRKVVYW